MAADEVFISMATYRDENCPTTLTEAFKYVRTQPQTIIDAPTYIYTPRSTDQAINHTTQIKTPHTGYNFKHLIDPTHTTFIKFI